MLTNDRNKNIFIYKIEDVFYFDIFIIMDFKTKKLCRLHAMHAFHKRKLHKKILMKTKIPSEIIPNVLSYLGEIPFPIKKYF